MKNSVPASALSADVIGRLEAAQEFIERRFARNPTLVDIAEQAGLSRFHFHRLFIQHFGKTPKGLLDELRMAAAKEMLNAGQSILEVAEALEFSHQSHFTNRFKQLVGETPGRWIRQQKLNPDLFKPRGQKRVKEA